jgi:hypothetical protein
MIFIYLFLQKNKAYIKISIVHGIFTSYKITVIDTKHVHVFPNF